MSASQNTKIQTEQGGATLVVQSGGSIKIESGGTITNAGTQASAIAALTDNSAGTANDTIQALADGTTYANDVAAIRNNFADLAAKVNAITAALRGAGIIAP